MPSMKFTITRNFLFKKKTVASTLKYATAHSSRARTYIFTLLLATPSVTLKMYFAK